MRPYYEQDGITIYHGDCREVLPTLKGIDADMMATDPPYGVSWQSHYRSEMFDVLVGDDGTLDIPRCLALALTCLKNIAHVYIFGRFDLSGLCLAGQTELIWDKAIIGPGDLESPWGPAHEYITFASYIKSTSQRSAGRGRLTARLRKGSIVRVPRLHGQAVSQHPTEKPVLLMRQLIESSSIIGDIVLDPFAGSGSTLVAAREEGRKAIGIEIEERYCEIAVKRLAQGILFGEGAA